MNFDINTKLASLRNLISKASSYKDKEIAHQAGIGANMTEDEIKNAFAELERENERLRAALIKSEKERDDLAQSVSFTHSLNQ